MDSQKNTSKRFVYRQRDPAWLRERFDVSEEEGSDKHPSSRIRSRALLPYQVPSRPAFMRALVHEIRCGRSIARLYATMLAKTIVETEPRFRGEFEARLRSLGVQIDPADKKRASL